MLIQLRRRSLEIKENLKKLKTECRQSLVTSLPSRIKTLVIAVRNYAKDDIKNFCPCLILLDFHFVSYILSAIAVLFHVKISQKQVLNSFQTSSVKL